ncbi:hypothetical protein OG900_17070 [Streptomyces sp. NBC_00433]
MEFTISGRLRQRGAWMLRAAAAGFTGLIVWLAVRGVPSSPAGPLTVAALSALCGLRGAAELRRARRPFRLRADSFGLTLHDAELSWEQIDAVALEYRKSDEDSAPMRPKLVLWTVPGVSLPRKADNAYMPRIVEALGLTLDGRSRYTLLDTDDLDQPLSALGAALAEHGGARFETAPRSVRTPTPVPVSGPELRVPHLPEQVFTAPGKAGPWALLFLVLAPACTEPLVGSFFGQRHPVPLVFLGPLSAVAALSWWAALFLYARWRRPRRLAVGPSGIAARRAPGAEEVFLGWPQIAALTVGPHPSRSGAWLIAWPVPGTTLPPDTPVHLASGHQSCLLTPLDRLPGGPSAILPTLAPFAGERLSPPGASPTPNPSP